MSDTEAQCKLAFLQGYFQGLEVSIEGRIKDIERELELHETPYAHGQINAFKFILKNMKNKNYVE